MRVAITGHTRGIGKSLYDHFKHQGHEVLGFSKSNNFDITNEKSRNEIIENLKNCNIFINNAYALDAQKQLLNDAIELWEGTTNTIINIDSKSTLMKTIPNYMAKYVQDKNQQKEIIKNRIFKARPYIINFTVGLVDTEMSKEFDSKKIDPDNLAKFIYTLLEFKSTIAVQDILVEVPDLDWNDIKRI
jgi:NADP-dependent 3-hydroxy acid dehydrogenase YdfG